MVFKYSDVNSPRINCCQLGPVPSFEMFLKIYDIYKLENPDAKPATETLPTTCKIE